MKMAANLLHGGKHAVDKVRQMSWSNNGRIQPLSLWAILIIFCSQVSGFAKCKRKGNTLQHCYDETTDDKAACSIQEVLVSTKMKFDISLVLKKSCLRKLATSPTKLL